MQEIYLLEHNYPVYIAVWLAVTLFILWFFKFMYRKMRDTEDRQTKSSLFTITVFIGVPLLLASVIVPLVFIIGDKNMETAYRFIWIGLIAVFLIYFIIKQKSPAKK